MNKLSTYVNILHHTRQPGKDILLLLLGEELRKHGIVNIHSNIAEPTEDDVEQYREHLLAYPTFITVHSARPTFQMLQTFGVEGLVSIQPKPELFRYADLGKEIHSQITIMGGTHSGKSVIAVILEKVIKDFEPDAVVHVCDQDEVLHPFYQLTDEQQKYVCEFTNRAQINLGGMIHDEIRHLKAEAEMEV